MTVPTLYIPSNSSVTTTSGTYAVITAWTDPTVIDPNVFTWTKAMGIAEAGEGEYLVQWHGYASAATNDATIGLKGQYKIDAGSWTDIPGTLNETPIATLASYTSRIEGRGYVTVASGEDLDLRLVVARLAGTGTPTVPSGSLFLKSNRWYVTAPGRFCCCTGTSDEPLEDCPLTLFDFPSECFALSYRLVLTDVEITWCELGGDVTCTETLSVQVDFELGLNWQVLSATGLTITSGGTKWTDVRFIVQCMPKGWAEHPDGTSDYMVMYLDFDYDFSGDPCLMDLVTFEEGRIGLYLISPTPRRPRTCAFRSGLTPHSARDRDSCSRTPNRTAMSVAARTTTPASAVAEAGSVSRRWRLRS